MSDDQNAGTKQEISADANADKAPEAKAPPEQITPPAASTIGDPPLEKGGGVGWSDIGELLHSHGRDGDGIVLTVLEQAEQFFLAVFSDAHYPPDTDRWSLLSGGSISERTALGRYILTRAPTAEVLFNKARELGAGAYEDRTFADLSPAERASLELAVRLGPAIKGALDAVIAEADARHPPPKIPLRSQPVADDETIFEQVHGAFERM